MNCEYYNMFEQNYKNCQWWKDKKSRIDQTIKDFNSNNPNLIARAEAQTKVRISVNELGERSLLNSNTYHSAKSRLG